MPDTTPAWGLLLAGVLFCATSHSASASAWLQEKGNTQLITTANYYRAGEYFDNGGKRTSQAIFSKYELNPYVEYGLTERWTVGASLFLPYADQKNTAAGTDENYAFGDSEWFARTQLWSNENSVVSLKPFVKLPGLDDSDDLPKLISTHPDAGLAVSYGTNLSLFGYASFADIEAGYRYRFGSIHDQVQLAATLGTRVTPDILLLPQFFATWRTDSKPNASFSQSPQDDYNLLKAQFSVVVPLDDVTDIQAGAFTTIHGRNTGNGRGVVFALWRRF